MKLRNYSNIAIKAIDWHDLASKFRLSQRLPHAVADEYGIYQNSDQLRVYINQALEKNRISHTTTLYRYAPGKVSMFPCPSCSEGFLVFNFIEALLTAWIHQYHELTYEKYFVDRNFDEHVDMVSRCYTKTMFLALGGEFDESFICKKFDIGMLNITKFDENLLYEYHEAIVVV